MHSAHTRTHRHIRAKAKKYRRVRISLFCYVWIPALGFFLLFFSLRLFFAPLFSGSRPFVLFLSMSLTRFLRAFRMDAFMQNANLISTISSIFISITSFVFLPLLHFINNMGALRALLHLLNKCEYWNCIRVFHVTWHGISTVSLLLIDQRKE